jgi:hypothetical protein
VKEFSFSRFYAISPEYKIITPVFLEWFLGMFEGDGSLIKAERGD